MYDAHKHTHAYMHKHTHIHKHPNTHIPHTHTHTSWEKADNFTMWSVHMVKLSGKTCAKNYHAFPLKHENKLLS